MFPYFYIDSCKGNAQIVKAEGDNIIYKNSEEHTSPIKNTYKVGNEYLIVTENTIYLISATLLLNNFIFWFYYIYHIFHNLHNLKDLNN